jgi:hypothetical protein
MTLLTSEARCEFRRVLFNVTAPSQPPMEPFHFYLPFQMLPWLFRRGPSYISPSSPFRFLLVGVSHVWH